MHAGIVENLENVIALKQRDRFKKQNPVFYAWENVNTILYYNYGECEK